MQQKIINIYRPAKANSEETIKQFMFNDGWRIVSISTSSYMFGSMPMIAITLLMQKD